MIEASVTEQGWAGARRPILTGRANRVLTAADRVIASIEAAFGVVVMTAIAVLLVLQVFVRYVLNAPLFWIEEVARLAMIWMVLVGIGYAVAKAIHLTVTGMTDWLPIAARGWLARIALLIIVLTSVPLALAGVDLAEQLAGVTASSSGLSRALYFIPTAVGYGLAALHAVVALLIRPLDKVEQAPAESEHTA